MAISKNQIETMLRRMVEADFNSLQSKSIQFFEYLDANLDNKEKLNEYDSARVKWKDWPPTKGSFGPDARLPSSLEDCKTLAWDMYRTCTERDGSWVTGIFFNRSIDASIEALHNNFLEYFTEALNDVAEEDLRDAASEYQVTPDSDSEPIEWQEPLKFLHPEVLRLSAKLFVEGNYRQAILDAFIGLDDYVKTKSGEPETGASLMQKVFSPNSPRFTLSGNAEEQKGFMFLYTGAIKAIRNDYGHRITHPTNAETAFELLAFASLLFRQLDPHV